MKKLLTFLALSFGVCSAGAAVYTFDNSNLNPGALAGQDNWIVFTGTSDLIQAGTGFDTSNVMANPGSSGSHSMERQNDSNFSFGNLTGVTGLTLSFDTRVNNNNPESGQIFFRLGGPGGLTNLSPEFSYGQVNGATPFWGLGAGPNAASGLLPAGITTGDWIRLTFVMDFTTNGGQGTGSLFFDDLTNPSFHPDLQLASGLNLAGAGSQSNFWNTMYALDGGASMAVLDNLTVIPTFAAVPEVNGAWIAAACAVWIGVRLVRRHHSAESAV